MRRVARVADIGARRAWLWHNRSAYQRKCTSDLPRLFVDVSAIIRHDAQTGIQRVVRAVWTELAKRTGDGFAATPVYATNRRGYCTAPIDFLDDRPRHLDREPVSMGPADKFLGLDLSAHLLPKYRDQLRAWRRNGASLHVIVYDLLPLARPEWFNNAAVGHFRKWFQLLASDVDEAICISDHVARDLRDRLGARLNPRIGRLYMGGDINGSKPSSGLSPNVREVVERMASRATILMVGTVEPRKGYDAAIEAFEYLWSAYGSSAPDLVIVGKSGWRTSELQSRLLSHPKLGRHLHWLDRVSDEGLCLLYEAAQAVFIASRGEGFGLPLIEAACHRRHVLARDLPVFREHRLANILFFDSDEPAALGGRLLELLNISRERSVTTPIAVPTWTECVDRLLAHIGLISIESQPDASIRTAI